MGEGVGRCAQGCHVICQSYFEGELETMKQERIRPEWQPSDADDTYACNILRGVEGGHDGMPGQSTTRISTRPRPRRAELTVAEAVAGIRAGEVAVLARAISLVESNAPRHRPLAREILRACLPLSGRALRVGITGVPGAGKSTFLECLGKRLCAAGKRVAILAVDPSSSVTGGSVLGDKTRMEELSRETNAYIRPSPSSGTLGGVAAKTREAMILCEAAGYDIVFVETVGVGQSEVAVRSMVDFFLLLQIAGAGDELQGIKKGVIEMADAIVVNKADGDNERKARSARIDFDRTLHYLQPYTKGWRPRALCCSAMTGLGVDELWKLIEGFAARQQESGRWERTRREQNTQWLRTLLDEVARQRFFSQPSVASLLPGLEGEVAAGTLPPLEAVERLLGEC